MLSNRRFQNTGDVRHVLERIAGFGSPPQVPESHAKLRDRHRERLVNT